MPKIDWIDDNNDNQARWEPRPRRDRGPRENRERRARLEQIIAMAAVPPMLPEPQPRRPLHLIWGRPVGRSARDAEGSADQDQRQG